MLGRRLAYPSCCRTRLMSWHPDFHVREYVRGSLCALSLIVAVLGGLLANATECAS